MRRRDFSVSASSKLSSKRSRALRHAVIPAAALALGGFEFANAAPYASSVTGANGTNVSFILNENADSLTYSLNGGSALSLTPNKGVEGFAKAAGDTFTITAIQSSSTGYNVPTGSIIPNTPTNLSQPTAEGGGRLTSDDTNNLDKYNSPRGVDIGRNPNAATFGITYVANSAAGSVLGRTLQKGLYAIKADQTDAFGYGDAAQQVPLFTGGSTNGPYRFTVAPNGEIYINSLSDAISGVWKVDPTLQTNTQLLGGTTGPTALPPGQNHGSIYASVVTGSTATNDLTLYTIDEDLTTLQATGSGSSTDTNQAWQYNIGGNTLPYTAMPTKLGGSLIIPGFTIISDITHGADGKFYLTESRAQPATVSGLFVLDSTGNQLMGTLTESRALLHSATANDILSGVQGMAVSDDQRWMACELNGDAVAVIPLINGIPDIANRLIVNTAGSTSGRDIAFDAADNITYVSSGQGLLRVLSTGGTAVTQLSWNGTSYTFNESVGALTWTGGSGAWDGAATNFSALGTSTATTTGGDQVSFSGTNTVTVTGTQTAQRLTVNGNTTFNGGTIATGDIDVATGVTATVNSVLSGGPNSSLTKSSPGTAILTGSNTYDGLTYVMGGTLQVSASANLGDESSNNFVLLNNGGTLKTTGSFTTNRLVFTGSAGGTVDTNGNAVTVGDIEGIGTLTKAGAGTLTGNHVRTTGNLTLNGGTLQVAAQADPTDPGSFAGTSKVKNISSTGGRMDITNNKLITKSPVGTWNGAAYSDVTGLLASGRNNSNAWNGATGIVSSTAAGSNFHSVGIAAATDVFPSIGTTTQLWAGQTIASTDTLVMYTYGGDATLDGKINVDDYIKIDSGISAGLTGWFNGDFNYDGKINIDDYTQFIDANIGTQGPQIATAGGGIGGGTVAVPEPASIAVLGVAALGLMGGARRRRPSNL